MWIAQVDWFLSFTWENLNTSIWGSPQGQFTWQRFIPFLDVDLLDSFEWLSVKHAGKKKVSMIMLSIHLSVLLSSFNCFYFNDIWQDVMMLCLTKILHSHKYNENWYQGKNNLKTGHNYCNYSKYWPLPKLTLATNIEWWLFYSLPESKIWETEESLLTVDNSGAGNSLFNEYVSFDVNWHDTSESNWHKYILDIWCTSSPALGQERKSRI